MKIDAGAVSVLRQSNPNGGEWTLGCSKPGQGLQCTWPWVDATPTSPGHSKERDADLKTKYSVSISNRQGLKSYNCLTSLTAGRENYLSHGGPPLLQMPLSWASVGTAREKGLRSRYSIWGLYAERWSGPVTVTGTVRAIALSFYCAYIGALSEC